MQIVFTLSIIVPALLALIRYKHIHPVYLPFLILIWVAFFNETISVTLVSLHFYNIINNSIYYLLESILILWQFNRWNLFRQHKKFFNALVVIFLILWFINCIFISHFKAFPSYFSIVYSFVIVLMSVNMLNSLLIRENQQLFRNPVFLICIGFIIFFTYNTLVEIFWLYGLASSKSFRLYIFNILSYINLLSNLIYALAILWMPRKQEFTLP